MTQAADKRAEYHETVAHTLGFKSAQEAYNTMGKTFLKLANVNAPSINKNPGITKYLRTLITEKGRELDDEITAVNEHGHFGLTYKMLIDFIAEMPQHHKQIRNTLVAIDFKNGNVFHYLDHLAVGMVKATHG